MTPTIYDGEIVRVRPIQLGDVRCGAILLYREHGRLILHRLIRRNSRTGELLFVGDAALRGQEPVNAEKIVGIAITVQRAGRAIALDTQAARWRGRLRYRIRPLRRLMGYCLQASHISTPAD